MTAMYQSINQSIQTNLRSTISMSKANQRTIACRVTYYKIWKHFNNK